MKRARHFVTALSFSILALEGGAWLADAASGFHYELLDRLQTAERSSRPIEAVDPDWPDGAIRVRVPDRGGPRPMPYALGGRVIEDAWPDAKQDWLRSGELDDRPRAFVLGGSAAMGFPYRYEDTFARRLDRALPGVQVVNAGQVGWASGQVLGVARRVLSGFAPDVLVIYSGNNEWIRWSEERATGPFAPDTQRALARSRALAAALWLGHQLRPVSPLSKEPPLLGWRHALAHPDRALDVGAWRRERAAHLVAFRRHLVAIREDARRAGARVIFCTVPFSHRLSPSFRQRQPDAFDPRHARDVRALEARAGRALEAGDSTRALALADEAIALDPEPAILHHLRGAALEGLGRDRDAETAYRESRERMVGHLGARRSVDRIVREVAVGDGVELLDLTRAFDDAEHARGRAFVEDLIHDDCHPTPAGHRLVAELLEERLRGLALARRAMGNTSGR